MIKNVLENITDIHVYPVVALILFVLVFGGAAVMAATMKKSAVAQMSRMPLEDSTQTTEGELQ